MRNNLYWQPGEAKVHFASKSREESRAAGMDEDSVMADPLFADPLGRDFRLRSGSPAARIAFEQFDFSAAGPRAEVLRNPPAEMDEIPHNSPLQP